MDVLGATVFCEYGESIVLDFYGSWLLLVAGGEPTVDRPDVTFEHPAEQGRVGHAMTLRVLNCHAAYQELRGQGAHFLTPPHDWGGEIRCFLRDPDGHLVEVSEAL